MASCCDIKTRAELSLFLDYFDILCTGDKSLTAYSFTSSSKFFSPNKDLKTLKIKGFQTGCGDGGY